MYLRRRGPASFGVTISAGYNPDGSKRRIDKTIRVDPRKTDAAQRREAERIAQALETDFLRHVITAEKRIPLSALADEWMRSHGPRLAESTRANYAFLLSHGILPALGSVCVQEITPQHIRRFLAGLAAAPAAARSKSGHLSGYMLLHYFRVLHMLLGFAVRSGYISVNPADAVEAPKRDTQPTAFYEMDDCKRLLSVLAQEPLQWETFFSIALYTGMRPGEIVALNWSDIAGDSLTVSAGAVYVKGQGTIRTNRPKTPRSVRKIVIPPSLLRLLQKYRAEQSAYRLRFGEAWPEPDAVFTTATGNRMHIGSPTKRFQKLIARNGLRPITLYGLRHTAASIMIAQGLTPVEVAARLGHAQTSTTLDIYAHAFMDANERATAAVASVLDPMRERRL